MENNTNNNKMTNDDLLRYSVGALIVLAFLSILGLYLILFSSGVLRGGANSAAVFQATEQIPEVEDRIVTLQKELDTANKKVVDAGATAKNVFADQSYLGTSATASTAPAPSLLKIKTFQADQANVASGSAVKFTYSSSNLENGVSYRIFIECPAGVIATYATGANLCRTNIGQALAIDNTGSYSVNFTNSSSESKTSIVILLAYDMTNNNIVLRDSKVLTVTTRPSGYTGTYTASLQPVTLSRTPANSKAPATISFIATLNNLKTCLPTSWNFGDGYTSSVDTICPGTADYYTNSSTRQISENHVYNIPGTYTITFTAGGDSVTATVYIESNTVVSYTPVYPQSYYSNYNNQNPYNYNYQQPVYNYVPQPYYVNVPNPQPVYVYQTPVNNAPVAPVLNSITRTDANRTTNLSWSSSGSNVYYRIFRSTISNEAITNNSAPACTPVSTHSCVIVSGTNDATYLLQSVDAEYEVPLTYFYRVRAYNSTGASEFSNEVISRPSTAVVNPVLNPIVVVNPLVGPLPPGNVTDLRAVASSNNITLSWSAPTSGGQVIGYDLYRSTNPTVPLNNSATVGFFGLPISARVYVDSSASSGVVYYYKLFPLGYPADNNSGSNITSGISLVSPVVIQTPSVTNFTINGQTAPSVDSGQALALSYGGSFISSYKLFVQCPGNVSAPDQQSGADLCRTSQNNAPAVSNSGNFQLTLINLNSVYQTVAVTILGLKTDGSVGSSVTRYITVRNQAGL